MEKQDPPDELDTLPDEFKSRLPPIVRCQPLTEEERELLKTELGAFRRIMDNYALTGPTFVRDGFRDNEAFAMKASLTPEQAAALANDPRMVTVFTDGEVVQQDTLEEVRERVLASTDGYKLHHPGEKKP